MSVPPRKVFFWGGGLNYNKKPDDLFLFYFFCNFHNYSIRYFLVFKKSFLNWVVFFSPPFFITLTMKFFNYFLFNFFSISKLAKKKKRERKKNAYARTNWPLRVLRFMFEAWDCFLRTSEENNSYHCPHTLNYAFKYRNILKCCKVWIKSS